MFKVAGGETPRVEQGKPFDAEPVTAHGFGKDTAVQSDIEYERLYWMIGSYDSL